MKAYLSGAIENADDEGKLWRDEITQWLADKLKHQVFNPLEVEKTLITPEEQKNFHSWRETDYERFHSVMRKFIERDLDGVCSDTDYLICFWDDAVRDGGGTHGEVTVAYRCHIPVYIVLGMPFSKVSAWILGCSTELFNSFEELKEFLEKKYG